jgi:predicted RNA-binding Zn-ribbon protein involved in translation (DUF1610 family)
MSDLLDRFHQVLVQEIRKNRPEYLEDLFTVAEIYQNLVPYRTHRDAIGVEMNGDYEDALLRLLSGEGDYLMIESEVARREIREELQSSNPNTGLFRDFAAADVRLTSAHLRVADEVVQAEPEAELRGGPVDEHGEDESDTADLADLLAEAEDPSEVEMDFGESDNSEEEEEPVDEAESDIEEALATEADSSDAAQDSCHWCRADLPERAVLNFCPFCGSDLRLTPCVGCGQELEPGWRFCPECGTEAEG